MSKQKTKDEIEMQEKNIDQSNKCNNGQQNNSTVADMLISMEDKKSFFFLKKEPNFQEVTVKDGFINEGAASRMDHGAMIVDDEKKTILYILIDATTLCRTDRMKGKAFEGLDQYLLKDVIEEKLFEKYPQYKNYKVIHTSVVVYPIEIIASPEKIEQEKRNVRNFCINVNYKLNSYASRPGYHLIDAAMKLDELIKVIRQILNNMRRYNFSQDLLADVWKEIHSTYEYMPVRALTKDNVKNHKDHLVYCLKSNNTKYTIDDLKEFAKTLDVFLDGSETKEVMIGKIVGHIITKE